MERTLASIVDELNRLNDDNLAERVIRNNDVQWSLSELQDILDVIGDMPVDRLRELAQADVAQKFIPGSEVWVVERDEDGEATEVSGYVFVVSVSGVAIVSSSINGCSDLDFILGDFVKETARSFSGDFSGYPISDCYKSHGEADAALRREQDG